MNDERIENCWNDKWKGKAKYFEKNLPYYSIQHNSLMNCPGIERRPLQWASGDYLPELWHGSWKQKTNYGYI
jgi:hypothetical protein